MAFILKNMVATKWKHFRCEIFISPETKDLPNVRIVFWSKDILLIKKIKNLFTNRNKIKQYLSS